MKTSPLRALAALLLLPACASSGPEPVERPPGDTFVQEIPGTDVSFAMTYLPGGRVTLGSPEGAPGRDPDEGPRRTVAVSPFWMGVHEVTSEAYALFQAFGRTASREEDGPDALTGPTPPYEDPMQGMGGDDRPAAGMTWWGALQYSRWLSLETGRLYRLPTEAEWEYACRSGGAEGAGGSGEATERPLGARAWYEENAGGATHPVGGLEPTRWGLHDVLGNVAEWTLDGYDSEYYAALEEGARDPLVASAPSDTHTVRGGSFRDPAEEVRCAERLPSTPRWQRRDPQLPKSRWWNTDAPHVGFRLVSPAGERSVEEIRAYWRELLSEGP